jgi:hypothetical protein
MNLEFSFKITKDWYASGAYDGSTAIIYLPAFFSVFVRDVWLAFGVPDGDEWEAYYSDMIWMLNWTIVHELIHNLGIRHTKKWTSRDFP